jgi:hypothetical protein
LWRCPRKEQIQALLGVLCPAVEVFSGIWNVRE